MKETNDSSILENANEKMAEFISRMKNEYNLGNDTIIEFDGAETITVKWWNGFATSTFNIYGENTISMSAHKVFKEQDFYTIAGSLEDEELCTIASFHNEYHFDIRQMLIWYSGEQSRAEDDNDEIEEIEEIDFDALCEELDKALSDAAAKKKK